MKTGKFQFLGHKNFECNSNLTIDAVDREREEREKAGGGILGAIKEKLTPSQMTEPAKDARVTYGGLGEPKAGHRLAVDEEGTPVVVEEGTTLGEETAEKLREADQMTGQAFNDVGPIDDDDDAEEAVIRVRLERRAGKM